MDCLNLNLGNLFQGSTPSLFVGTTAFEVIVKQQIKRLEEPSLKCCQLVYDELIRILGQLLVKVVSYTSFHPSFPLISFFTALLASVQTLSCASRTFQFCRCQLLQEVHGANNQVGVGHGVVSFAT
jgi:hypothetical protein